MGGSILELIGASKNERPNNIFGIMGEAGSGKTTAALTFPNPIVGNLDNKLPPGIITVDFYKDEFAYDMFNVEASKRGTAWPNRRDAIKKWLKEKGPLIPEDYTFILDSWTTLCQIFDVHAENNPQEFMTKGTPGNPPTFDKRAMFARYITYYLEIFQHLRNMRCQVVIIFHETFDRDPETKRPLSKMRPLMDGQMKDKLAAQCGMLVRQVCVAKPNIVPTEDDYRWLICSTPNYNAIISPRYKFPRVNEKGEPLLAIKANYSELTKYEVKPT